MKKVKVIGNFLMSGILEKKEPFCFVLCSLLIALSLAGCLYPIGPSKTTNTAGENSPKTEETPPVKPFSVDIVIGEQPAARSVVGPDSIRIQGDIRNVFQLVVMDDTSKKIAAYVEKRLTAGDTAMELVIESLPFGKTYHFLLLMGYWDQVGGNNNPYDYVNTAPPTLLAAGLKTEPVNESKIVTVTMWPVIVDTKFNSGTAEPVSPVVQAGVPQAAKLYPGVWDVKWTIQRGVGGNGLADLVKAQKAADAGAGDTLQSDGAPQFKQNGGAGIDTSLSEPSAWNIIRNTIGTFGWNDIGQVSGKGYVNFNLAYAPFNLTAADSWQTVKESFVEAATESVFHIDTGQVPKWIIRNGVNDLAQDSNTNFVNFMRLTGDTLADSNANGNGGTLFTVELPTYSAALKVTDGWLTSYPPVSGGDAKIKFTTTGYSGDAELRYVELDSGPSASTPAVLDFTNSLESSYAQGAHTGETVGMTGSVIEKDLWVMLYKDGKVGDPHKIQWLQVTIGPWAVPMNIKSTGNNSANGDYSHPVQTLDQALLRLQAYYKENYLDKKRGADDWMHDNGPALIYIHDTVTTSGVTLDGSYPPIYLSSTGTGVLQLAQSGGSLITLTNGMKLYLEDITLKGVGSNTAALVTVAGGELFKGYYGGVEPKFENNINTGGGNDDIDIDIK
jgi:hypothetical protein